MTSFGKKRVETVLETSVEIPWFVFFILNFCWRLAVSRSTRAVYSRTGDFNLALASGALGFVRMGRSPFLSREAGGKDLANLAP